jgi:DnaJ-class molecular chaperone
MLKIEEEERCTVCDGLGIMRARYSSPRHTDKDWRKCLRCRGTGRKLKDIEV